MSKYSFEPGDSNVTERTSRFLNSLLQTVLNHNYKCHVIEKNEREEEIDSEQYYLHKTLYNLEFKKDLNEFIETSCFRLINQIIEDNKIYNIPLSILDLNSFK